MPLPCRYPASQPPVRTCLKSDPNPRKIVFTYDATGVKTLINEIAEFLASDAAEFSVESDEPVFRACTMGSNFTQEELTVMSAGRFFSRASDITSLSNPRLHNIPRYVGDVARIAYGKEGQQLALNHDVRHDVGRTTYANTLAALGLARTVLREFKP